jgi:hypothetical protein
MTVSMGMLIFAGLGYALEKDEPDTQFYTLPQTLYWAIITMTSTGQDHECSLSLWRVVRGSKLMHLDLIHGLFIT